MRYGVALSALLAAAVASAAPSKQVKVLEDSFAVPGENPLFYCEDPAPYLLTIEDVKLSPNPPAAGQNLTITAKGAFTEEIEDGAKVHVSVKYGVITIIRQTYDLCKLGESIDLECPIKKGEQKLTKQVELPSLIPPGKYTVQADVETKDEKKITCLTAQVEFHRSESVQQVLGGWKGA